MMSATCVEKSTKMPVGSDDFLIPTNVDLSEQCTSLSKIEWSKVILPTGAIISLTCYSYLLWMYFVVNSPVLKRHPTTLAIYKAIFSIIYVQQYLWLPFTNTSVFYESYSTDDVDPVYYCVASTTAAFLSFVSQFSLIASQLCFLVISVDLRNAYTNPFSSYQQNRFYFAGLVIGFSALTGVALMFMGPRVYGLSTEGTVWIQDRRANSSTVWPKGFLFYVIIAMIYIYSIWANFQYYYQTKDSKFSNSFKHRLSIMERSKKYTFGYVLYESITLLCEFISYLNFADSFFVYSLPSYFYCFQGLWDLTVILYSNWSEITWQNINPFGKQDGEVTLADVAQEGLRLHPHLNTALRAEILYFTTQGIMFASKQLQETEETISAETPYVKSFLEYEKSIEPITFSYEDEASAQLNGNLRISRRSSSNKDVVISSKESSEKNNQANGSSRQSLNTSLNTLLEIDKAQGEAVTVIREAALRDQYEKLGVQDGHIQSSKQTQISISHRPSRGSGMVISKSVAAGSSGTVKNPLVEGARSENSTTMPTEVDLELQKKPDIDNNKVATEKIPSQNSTVSRATTIRRSSFFSGANGTDRVSSNSDAMDATATTTDDDDGKSAYRQQSMRIGVLQVINTATGAAKALFVSAYGDFRFNDFCAPYFRHVRTMCGVVEEDYAKAFESTCKESFSEGRSGAFMFFSADQRFIVKTTSKQDMAALYRIVPKYVEYLKTNPDSLIVRFLGAHSITMYGVKLYFVVMLNVFPTFALSERYDLKGSWVNRHGYNGGNKKTRSEMLVRREQPSSAPLYQDNDLQHKISLQPEVIKSFVGQIKKDAEFLRACKLMDYSLLVGVKRERFAVLGKSGNATRNSEVDGSNSISSAAQNCEEEAQQSTHSSFSKGMQARIVEGPGMYYFGIIDILQEFNFSKRLERFVKVYFKFQDPDGVSVIEPNAYAKRFWQRCILDTFEGCDDGDDVDQDEPSRQSYVIQESFASYDSQI